MSGVWEWVRLLAEVFPGFVLLSLLLPLALHVRRKRWAYQAMGLIVLYVLVALPGYVRTAEALALLIEAASVAFLLRSYPELRRLRADWRRLFAREAKTAVVLAPPFEGRWKASSTGPYPATNHHLMASDQWFAVDWVRVDAPSRGSRILSPVDGVVAWAEDGHADMPPSRWRVHRNLQSPAGNYLSLRVAREGKDDVYVILAHLERGSLQVTSGQKVHVGDWLARCGNSGNTTVPHLHVHAQPAERMAPGKLWGVPILFTGAGDPASASKWMKPGRILPGGAGAPRQAEAF